MAEEFEQFSAHLRRSIAEILFRQFVEQLGVSLIVEAIFSRPGRVTRIQVVVGQIRLARAGLAEQGSVAIQSCIKTCFKHAFRTGSGCFELQDF